MSQIEEQNNTFTPVRSGLEEFPSVKYSKERFVILNELGTESFSLE